MSSKNAPEYNQQTFQLFLHHADIVTLMNDADVALDDRNVPTDQIFEVWIEKANGSRIYLRDMQVTDKVMFQFNKVVQTDGPVTYTGINITP